MGLIRNAENGACRDCFYVWLYILSVFICVRTGMRVCVCEFVDTYVRVGM